MGAAKHIEPVPMHWPGLSLREHHNEDFLQNGMGVALRMNHLGGYQCQNILQIYSCVSKRWKLFGIGNGMGGMTLDVWYVAING